jgi:hypothetical protein
MGKKSGKAPKAVSPAAPEKVEEPVVADPGEAAKQKAAKQKAAETSSSTDTSQMKPHKPPKEEEPGTDESATQQAAEEEQEEEKKTSWIEIELVGEDDEPIPGEKYRIILPDGETFAEGTLDEKGLARVEGFEKGTCKVCFPDLDKDAWEKI